MAKRDTAQSAPRALVAGRAPHWHLLAGAVSIVAATFLAYSPSLRGGFILDDVMALTDNRLVKAPDGLYRFWNIMETHDAWPMTNSTFWIEWRLWGLQPTGYRVTNLLLHSGAAWLLWIILRRLTIPGAFLAALLFALHPVNVESVAWIAQRKGLLAMVFFLLSILAYLHTEAPRTGDHASGSSGSPPPSGHKRSLPDGWYGLSLAAFLLAMLSKASVAVLPALLLGIVWWLRPLTKRDVLRVLPFFLVAMLLVSVNIWFQTHGVETPAQKPDVIERLLGAGTVVWFYLYKAILPVHLIFFYPKWRIRTEELRWWLPLLAAVMTTGGLWRFRRSWSRPVLFAWGFFCIALLPVMGFTDITFMQYSLVADHYQHIALIAVVALGAAGWSLWQRWMRGPARWIPNTAAGVVVGIFAALTWQQSHLYADGAALYQDTLEKNPGSWMAENNLGALLLQRGQLAQAIEHDQRALQLKPDYADAHNNLGNALRRTGRLPEAIEHYKEALRLRPNYPEAHNNLGGALAVAGQLQDAIDHLRQALLLKPDYPEAQYNLGLALAQGGQLQEAIGAYRQAVGLNPDNAEGYYNLGIALARTAQVPEAIGSFREAVRLKPDYADAHSSLGTVLAENGQLREAIEQFQQALRLKPDDPDVQRSLEIALDMQQKAAP